MAHELLDQHGGVDIALGRRGLTRQLRCSNKEGGDGRDTVGAEEGELQGFLKCKWEFELSNDFLDAIGIFVGHGSKRARSRVGKGPAGGAETCMAQDSNREQVDEKQGDEIIMEWVASGDS